MARHVAQVHLYDPKSVKFYELAHSHPNIYGAVWIPGSYEWRPDGSIAFEPRSPLVLKRGLAIKFLKNKLNVHNVVCVGGSI